MRSHKNRLIGGIPMSTHNIDLPFSVQKKERKKENHCKLSQICSCWIFSRTQERVPNNRGKLVFEPLKFYCT